MTRNLFVGADLRSVFDILRGGAGFAAVPDAVAAIYRPTGPPGLVQRTAFAERAQLLADEIAAAAPDLIGLQEAARWQVRDPAAAEPARVDDHLEALEAALAQRGRSYRRAVVLEVGDVELPSADGTLVRLLNRVALLAREDASVADARSATFSAGLPIRTPLGTFGLTRGWVSVEVAGVRVACTHLEVGGGEAGRAQRAQAQELIALHADAPGPVVLLGDFNARPGSRTHQELIEAGYADAWALAHPGQDGFTCCHRVPLDDPADVLRSRIDHVFVRGGLRVADAAVVGADPAAFAGRWPSDHAGLVAEVVREGT